MVGCRDLALASFENGLKRSKLGQKNAIFSSSTGVLEVCRGGSWRVPGGPGGCQMGPNGSGGVREALGEGLGAQGREKTKTFQNGFKREI